MNPIYQKHHFSLMWPDYEAGRAHEQAMKTDEGRLFNQDIMERDVNANMILEGMEVRNEGRDYRREDHFLPPVDFKRFSEVSGDRNNG